MRSRILNSTTIAAGLLVCCSALADQADLSSASDPKYLPEPGSSPLFWHGRQQLAGFRNIDLLAQVRRIPASEDFLELPRAEMDLGDVELQVEGRTMTVDEFFEQQRVGGLLVIRDGQILYERYGMGNTEDTRWISFSVAKSVVSVLFGAAVLDGYITSLDEKVTDYLPRLKGSSYDHTTIRNLLQMASGVQWNEDYSDPESDVASADWETLELYEYLRDKPSNATPGEKFNYNTAETNLAGTLLRSAIGNNLSTYLSEKIWQPFGMESDAYWRLTEPGGGEFGGCCISATLRDYGRLGLFVLANGVLADGSAVLPADWIKESTTPSDAYQGYGYFWWLSPNGAFEASGIFGQGIYIDPAEQVVIAVHSAWEQEIDANWYLQTALYQALTQAVSGSVLR
jgi:CubicO group peptidase (beta-lactamase class C family)